MAETVREVALRRAKEFMDQGRAEAESLGIYNFAYPFNRVTLADEMLEFLEEIGCCKGFVKG